MFRPDTKFLVVDDFGTMRKLVKNILNEMKYHAVFEAANGQRGYEILQEQLKTTSPAEFVISSWKTPQISW